MYPALRELQNRLRVAIVAVATGKGSSLEHGLVPGVLAYTCSQKAADTDGPIDWRLWQTKRQIRSGLQSRYSCFHFLRHTPDTRTAPHSDQCFQQEFAEHSCIKARFCC